MPVHSDPLQNSLCISNFLLSNHSVFFSRYCKEIPRDSWWNHWKSSICCLWAWRGILLIILHYLNLNFTVGLCLVIIYLLAFQQTNPYYLCTYLTVVLGIIHWNKLCWKLWISQKRAFCSCCHTAWLLPLFGGASHSGAVLLCCLRQSQGIIL